MDKSINVHIGEAKIAHKNQQLHTILGSCCGIALLWPKRGLFGLAHCLLPQSPPNSDGVSARYVNQAIESLLEQLKITNVKDLRAVVAGGANMTLPDGTPSEKLIGHQNTQAALANLDALKIKIVHIDVGGFEGRKMFICCDTGTFDVRAIPRIAA